MCTCSGNTFNETSFGLSDLASNINQTEIVFRNLGFVPSSAADSFDDDLPSVGFALGALFTEIVFFGVCAWYLGQVVPGFQGASQPWCHDYLLSVCYLVYMLFTVSITICCSYTILVNKTDQVRQSRAERVRQRE